MQDQPATGRFDGREHRFPLRVYFEDTDLAGVVYHANYLRYMERARSDMLRLAGIDQRGAFERGEGAYAIADLAIRYAAPARLDDALLVASTVERVRPASIVIHQRVIRDALVLTEAQVTAALVGPPREVVLHGKPVMTSGRARRQPAAWLAIYQGLLGPTEGNA